ncbi:MAG TPA: ADOP family duplicated permease [Vicinamibacterales bacterium]|nr:ADOP family duplicated permease [Vicinamibacterales bacterium]
MRMLEHGWSDLRFALRQFKRRPGLTAAALLALACGLGGVITVFTLVDAVILRPLPVRAPHELVWMRDPSFSFPVFQEVQARGGMLSSVFAWTPQTLHAQWTTEPEPTPVLLASGRIHDTLGVRPVAGRLLTESDVGQSAADAQPVAVLSYAAWQRRFGGDPAAIGRTIRIEGAPFTIIGVTPQEFFGVAVGVPVDVTIPVTMLPRLRDDERTALTRAGLSWLHIMGRLQPGLSVTAADAAFQAIWPQILGATADGVDAAFRPRYLTFTSGLEPGVSGESPVRVHFREPLLLLLGLVALLLVAACATVANLLLAAAAGRRHELALRLALGASRRRIVQQLAVEGLLLAAAGAALGLLFSFWAADGLVRLLSTSYDIVVVNMAPDRRVIAFAAMVAAAATAAFTLAPIARASRIDPGPMLEAGGRHVGGAHRARLARMLVVVQVAISLTLLAGSALFVRNLRSLLATDVGFDRANLLVVSVDALSPASARSRAQANAPALVSYYAELLQRLSETPGVRSASLSFKPPISNEQGLWWGRIAAEGGPAPAWRERTYLNAISPGYFATIGTPLIAGRDFAPGDREGNPRVTIINAMLARAQFGNEPPIGRYLVIHGDEEETTRLEVVGVVRDTTYQNLQESRQRIAYFPYTQVPTLLRDRTLGAVVRTAGRTAGLADSIRDAVRKVDASVPLSISSVETRIDESLVGERLITVIAAFLGMMSLVLACGALGGLMSHLVASRTREIGLRLALGAERRLVLGLVMRQALAIAVLGAVVGLGLTLAAGRLVARFLTGIGPDDPLALAAAAGVLLATTAAAGYLPARRASRVDPMVALRVD